MYSTSDDPLEITKFCKFSHTMIDQILNCRIHFQSLLILSLLDTLSKSVFPTNRNNRERFITLLDRFSNWNYRQFVSLSQLDYLINNNSDLKSFLRAKINKYPDSVILRPEEADVSCDEISKYCSTDELLLVEKARYVSLLWTLRNSLAHSFMPPGNGMAISNNNSTPYYHESMLKGHWDLYIHPQVLALITRQTISNVADYFESNGINPYESFPWTSNWYEM